MTYLPPCKAAAQYAGFEQLKLSERNTFEKTDVVMIILYCNNIFISNDV